jgi:type II secretion system protein J
MTAIRNKGFTLAEVLVASTISAFIALVAVGALRAVSDSAQRVHRTTETTAEVRFAARMLARDLANLYRDQDPRNTRLVGASQGSDTSGPPFLTFYMVGRAKARADQPEGDLYEVEYMLGAQPRDGTNAAAEAETQSSVLFRRLWPNPHEDRNPGGVLTPIAENIGAFHMRFFDGQQWAGEWPEEMQSVPQLIEVTLATLPEGRTQPIVETFVVSCSRLTGAAPALEGGGQAGGQQQEAPAAQLGGEQGGPGPPSTR